MLHINSRFNSRENRLIFKHPGLGKLHENRIQQSESAADREPNTSECSLAVLNWNQKDGVEYHRVAGKLRETQGEYRGGGGSGLVMNGMTHGKVHSILQGAGNRQNRVRLFGPDDRTVDMSGAKKLEVIQIHSLNPNLDSILRGIEATGAKPLYVESIATNPRGLSFRTFKSTFADTDPSQIPLTYLRIFVNNPTEKSAVELEQSFRGNTPGVTVMSWSEVTEESSGLICYRLSGQAREFDTFFQDDLEEFPSTQFALHDRYPTQVSRPGVSSSQPRVQNKIWSMHNGDLVNPFTIKERLRDPGVHKYERLFFETYGKKGVTPKKFAYSHIDSVDSSVVAKLHTYLYDCCKNHGIDPLVISFFERPPSLEQIKSMPANERKFFTLARLAFPELSYQGSAATIVSTEEYIRVTPDRTRVLWIAKDYDNNVYIASNGGAIINACHPDDIAEIRPVPASETLSIDPNTGEITNSGMDFHIPNPTATNGDSEKSTVFMPGIGFDQKQLSVVTQNGSPKVAKTPFAEELYSEKLPRNISNNFGLYGFEHSDVVRLAVYSNTGSYHSIGLGNANPDGALTRNPYIARHSSEHKAFIVSPGRDNRIEFSSSTLLSNGDSEPLILSTPILVGSSILEETPEGKQLLAEIATKYGTITVDALTNQKRIKACYRKSEKLEAGLKRLIQEAKTLAAEGTENIILDDTISDDEIPIPGDIACSVIHNALKQFSIEVKDANGNTIKESLRSRVNIIADLHGIPNAEVVKECLAHGADAVCPKLMIDGGLGLFSPDKLNGQLTSDRPEMMQRGLNTLIGMNEDLAITSGSSGFHDIMALKGTAPGTEHELGIADDLNAYIGNLPGMRAGGLDLSALDLFQRSRLLQYGQKEDMKPDDLPKYTSGWERWNTQTLAILDRMTREGASYKFEAQEYEGMPIVTMEDMVTIDGLANLREFSDEELKDIDLRVLDFMAVTIGHMSIGANNIETWLAMLAAIYEIRHESQEGKIPFLNDKETLILAGIGEGGIAQEFRLFLMHICGQYASGRFGIETNDGDLFDRGVLQKEGILKIKGIQEGQFEETEISEIEKVMSQLINSEYVLKDLQDMEDGKLQKLCRFLSIIGIKNAQYAKSGYGGMLTKTIFLIAKIRGVTPHDAIKSFFNHADGDSIEELRERIYTICREAGGEIPELGDEEIMVWSKSASDPYMVPARFGEIKAGAVATDSDWRGGTGNRPVATNRAAHPWITEAKKLDAIWQDMLGLMTVNWASSNTTPVDAFKKTLEGNVDGWTLCTAMLRAMKCIIGNCRHCNTGMCGPVLTDQRTKQRGKLRIMDYGTEEDPDSKEVNVKTQKERAKRFMLAFMRTMKVLLKNVGATTIEEAGGKRDLLKIIEGVQVEGSEYIRELDGHPYTDDEVDRACNVSQRLDIGKFISKTDFDHAGLSKIIQNYLSLNAEGVSVEDFSRNAFLLVGDIVNIVPYLPKEQLASFIGFAGIANQKLKQSYKNFSGRQEVNFDRDQLMAEYRAGNLDRNHQEFLERLITGDRIMELLENFQRDGNVHALRDNFFSRTSHSTDANLSIKSPRAIVSQQNFFTIDTYKGAQRQVAQALVEHLKTKEQKEPFVITIDKPLTDKDMGVLSALNAIYHHFPEEFEKTVKSVEVRLTSGVSGHNLGALVNGNYLFGAGEGKSKLRIVVGSEEKPAHGDGSVGMSANGATIIVHGYIGDCGGSYASDLNLSCRGSAGKLAMGAKGNTVIYSHEALQDVSGICMNGNATIVTAGKQNPDEPRQRPIAKPLTGSDMQGLSKIAIPLTVKDAKAAQIAGKGTLIKKLSHLDQIEVGRTLESNYPRYENGQQAEFENQDWSKIVSENYYRNLITSLFVYDFYKMREDFSFEDQTDSAAGELLEVMGLDSNEEVNQQLIHAISTLLQSIRTSFINENKELIAKDPDAAFLKARAMALKLIEKLKTVQPESIEDVLTADVSTITA